MIYAAGGRGRAFFSDKSEFDFDSQIPGSAINDLIGAGKLPKDIFWRDNADKVREFEGCDYVYKREFEFCGEYKRIVIRFERIDTYAPKETQERKKGL